MLWMCRRLNFKAVQQNAKVQQWLNAGLDQESKPFHSQICLYSSSTLATFVVVESYELVNVGYILLVGL